ncbi:MAG: hypothetical protein HY075_00050, partial [Deltaproteobacteria bacterium]|nr:hypothetical protein [Deltaproteobacteria bacterium]
ISKPDKLNALDYVMANAKLEIARINKESEAELMGTKPTKEFHKKSEGFVTFAQCAQCHTAQYDFHKATPHMQAYETLVKKHQNNNLDCLKCHTVGAGQPTGWKSVNDVVINKADKAINAESFAKSLPNMDVSALSKISRAYVNVQCETCHGMGGDHPVGTDTKIHRAVTTDTCLQCHTPNQAPGWYKGGKPDTAVLEAKLKSMTCPVTRKN